MYYLLVVVSTFRGYQWSISVESIPTEPSERNQLAICIANIMVSKRSSETQNSPIDSRLVNALFSQHSLDSVLTFHLSTCHECKRQIRPVLNVSSETPALARTFFCPEYFSLISLYAQWEGSINDMKDEKIVSTGMFKNAWDVEIPET
jgi:hypothetical protein